MDFGDDDLPIFFADFGATVTFKGVTVKGNFSSPSDPFVGAGGLTRTKGQRFAIELPYNAFSPMPGQDDLIVVNQQQYRVKGEAARSDDGKIVTLELAQK